MKRIISLILVLCVALLAVSCGGKNEDGSGASSTVSYTLLDNSKSVAKAYFDKFGSDPLKMYFTFEMTQGGKTENAAIAINGNSYYVATYIDGKEASVFNDGTNAYRLDSAAKTATRLDDPSTIYAVNIATAFMRGDFNSFIEQGTAEYEGASYNYETFLSDTNKNVFYLENGAPKYIAFISGLSTSYNISMKVDKLNGDPDSALFAIPEGYTIVS